MSDTRHVTERELQERILCGKSAAALEREGCMECLAHVFGWRGWHAYPLKDRRGYWRTPLSGDLGEGFPDLFLVHETHGILLIEVKRDGKRLDPIQATVHEILWRARLRVLTVFGMDDTDQGSLLVGLLRGGRRPVTADDVARGYRASEGRPYEP